MSREDKDHKDSFFIEILHKTKEYILVFAMIIAALKYLSSYIDEITHGLKYANLAIYAIVAVIIFSLYFFTIRPLIIKRHELKMKPTGEPDEHYFTTSPRTDDKYHFFSAGYESYLEWLLHPKVPVLYLTGPSGSGKSSLINAYLVPELEKEKSAKTNIYPLRSYHQPLQVLYDAFAIDKKPGITITDETVLIEIEKAAGMLSPGEKILIVLDQFEEFFLLRKNPAQLPVPGEEAEKYPGSLQELKQFFHRFLSSPPQNVYILLSYRDDFQQLIDQLELPARVEHVNFEQVKLLSFEQAAKFLKSCPGLVIPEKRLNSILHEAASIDTPIALRPIVLNLLGIILKRMVGQSALSKKEGNLIRQYIIGCLGKELQEERATVLKAMLTDFNTARPRTLEELSNTSNLSVTHLDNQMLSMQRNGLVRCLDWEEPQQQKRKWQIAHDFVAVQLEKVVFGISKTIWQKARPWVAPVLTSVLIIFSSFLITGKEDAKKKKAIVNIEHAGLYWIESSKTISSTERNLTDTLFQSLLNEFVILQPDSLYILFNVDSNKQISSLHGLDKIRSLRKIFVQNSKKIENLDGLRELEALTSLELKDCNNLENIDGLKGLPALTILDISYCSNLQTVNGLKGLKTLTTLHVTNCDGLKNVDGLRELTALTTLYLSSCNDIKNVDGLKGLPVLRKLDLSFCHSLKNADGLKGLNALQALDLSYCGNLQTIAGLKGLSALKELNLSHCPKISKAQIDELIRALPQLKKGKFINDYYE
jgi:Leucine-rich repeat (LRR) protein